VHLKMISPRQLLQQLSKRLPLLSTGSRDAPARQQSMDAAIAWSYELLAPAPQRVFRALGVFVGGWTLEAAKSICLYDAASEPHERVLSMAALVETSLVACDG
jgi:predicted ATPase